jgi:hypothetical protein
VFSVANTIEIKKTNNISKFHKYAIKIYFAAISGANILQRSQKDFLQRTAEKSMEHRAGGEENEKME